MNCLICDRTTTKFEHTKLQKQYYHCSHCDYIFLNPVFHVGNEREKFQYDQHQNSLENQGYVAMFERFLEPIQLNKNDHILDFGSGPTPVLAQLLQNKGYRVTLFDPYYAPNIIEETARFDVITSTEVIEHIARPLEAFRFFSQHLHSGGTLALQTQFHPQNKHHFLEWWYPRDPTHIGFFQLRTFQYLAKEFDFELSYCDKKSIVIFKKL